MEMTDGSLISISIIFICLVLSSFFSASETALTSLDTLRVKHLVQSKGPAASPLRLWLNEPNRVLTTILIANNAINIFASSVATAFAIKIFQDQAIGIATGIITILVLIFGEIIPKSFAKAHAEKVSMIAIRAVTVLYYLMYPAVWFLSSFADRVVSAVAEENSAPPITEEQLEFLVNEGQKAGVFEDIKKDIIEGAIDFDETRVREIMTPRTDIIAIDEDANYDEATVQIVESGHSRIPVFRKNIDNIVGIVLAKDLLKARKGRDTDKLLAKNLMRNVPFAPDSKSIMEVFQDLKKSKNHLTILIDEYGGTAGIVTMEDILEEIVGEIQDEFDTEEAEIIEIDEGTFDVLASVNIDDFQEFFGIDKAELEAEAKDKDVDTLGGWMTQLASDMPKVGQKVEIDTLEMEVIEVDRHRIERIRVTKSTEPNSDKKNSADKPATS